MQNDNNLESLLTAQLSHSDGIRGFFVQYLTGGGGGGGDDKSSAADKPTVPEVLQKAMSKVDADELIPLACKSNIVMAGCLEMKYWIFDQTLKLNKTA